MKKESFIRDWKRGTNSPTPSGTGLAIVCVREKKDERWKESEEGEGEKRSI